MIINAVTYYMASNGIGTVGTDIFIGELPLDKADIISAVYVPSPHPNKAIPYYNQTIDFWARFKSYDDGMGKLQDLFDLFHQKENYEIDGFHVYLSYAMGMIDDMDRDMERRHLFRLSLSFIFRRGSEFS